MANFSQLRRRQSSREILYRSQFSDDVATRRRTYSVRTRAMLDKEEEVHADPDELGTLMWEMRPRHHTSAGELKRQIKKEQRQERQRRESGQKDKDGEPPPRPKTLQTIKDENELIPPSRVSSTSQFSQAPDGSGEVRESWDSKFTFILATVGYAVGLGNVWRFPYLAQKNGGGAFLIPYWIMLFAEGLPIFLLELAVGQRLRKGSIGVWKTVSPYMGGIGIASGVVSFNVALYYNTIIAWCLYYFVQSFQYPLPWSECPQVNVTDVNIIANNITHVDTEECAASSPTHYFWYRETLDISMDIEDVDNFNWKIAICLLAAWTLVYLCIIKGITENPKVIYITAIYPYVVLIIFFFRAITLEGMEDGIIHLFKPKWERLSDPVVWLEAGTQIFFSLGLAFGGLIAYASYNPVNNNCTRDALVVAFTNCATSMFAGIVIFAIMGFKANQRFRECEDQQDLALMQLFGRTNVTVPENGLVQWSPPGGGEPQTKSVPYCNLEKELDESASGTGLAFILFTEAVNQFPLGNLWAILFFLMLFTLGLDSQFGTLQGVIQCILDLKMFPNMRKELITGMVCTICLILSMVFAQGAGNYIFTLFNDFAGSVPLLVIALFECLAISYVYGLKRFSDDIELMTGNRPGLYWLICWKYISPLAMSGILVASFADMAINGSGYEAWDKVQGVIYKRDWPFWSQCLIGVLILASALWIPLVALLKSCGVTLLSPEPAGWFPADELRTHYELKEHKITKTERVLFGIREDGTEGLVCPTAPKDHSVPAPTPPAPIIGIQDDGDIDSII